MEFKVLGPQEVRRGDAVLPLGGPGQRALLAVLILCANEVVSTDRLSSLLWEDDPPDTARHILQINISRLRKVLEDDPSEPKILLTRAPGYVLSASAEAIDSIRFQTLVESGRELVSEDRARASARLAEALALWRGQVLADLALDPFTLPGVARLEEIRMSAVEDQIEAELALGHHAEVVGELRKLAFEYPLRERITQQLMLALYRSGRQSEALAAFEAARAKLASDLGIDPGSALQALERAVLQHDPSLSVKVAINGGSEAEEAGVDPSSAPLTREVRKTVTLVFCDVAGSTAMGDLLDPETLRRVMQRYFETMRDCIERHGGTVEKFIGDAVMAIFGVPQVHEDDALRAVRAASDMREALVALNKELDRDHGLTLTCRIGVNTGQVVAGSGDQVIVTGSAVNLAARLEQAASEGEVLLGASTFALVRDAVVAEPTEPLELKGKTGSVSAFKLIQVTPGAAGFARKLDAPIVGRERELSLLLNAFERTETDRACQLFTVLGTAGIGKSRLMSAFVEVLGERATVLRGRCLPYGEGITFYPLIEALIDLMDLDEAASMDDARTKLAALVGSTDHAARIAERVGQAIGIAGGHSAAEETLWGVRMLLERLASERPVVFLIDDLQWAEPRFLELVQHVADFARDAPILLACMARTELLDDHPMWAGGKLNATSIMLEPLGQEECGVLVANLLADDSLEADVRGLIAGAAGGNPLYAEEVTGLLVEEGRLFKDNGRWITSGDISEVSVPPTISALLASRLDKLPHQEQRLIEVGAVIGQLFYPRAVVDLVGMNRDNVEIGLTSLVRKQFVRPERSDLPGLDALGFRHLLIRDVAYEAIPKATRAELHERFADWYDQAAGSVGELDEILGYHLEQACRYRTDLGTVDDRSKDLSRRAGEHLGAAGLRAFARGDMVACTELLDRAGRLLPADHPLLLRVDDRLVTSFVVCGNLERAAEANVRRLEAARLRGDRSQEERARLVAMELEMYRAPRDLDAQEMRRCAHQAIDVFEEFANDEGLAQAHSILAEAALSSGQAATALAESEQAIIHARRSGMYVSFIGAVYHIGRSMWIGPTPISVALERLERLAEQVSDHRAAEAGAKSIVGWFLAYLGRFDEARLITRDQSAVFEELGNSFLVSSTEWDLSEIEWLAGNPELAEAGYRRMCDVFRSTGDDLNLADGLVLLAELLVVLSRDEEALQLTEDIQRIAAPDVWIQWRWRATRAVALAHLGQVREAMPLIEESETLIRSTDFMPMLAAAKLSKAEVFKVANRREEASVLAREALAMYEKKEFVPHIGWARSMIDSLTG